MELFEAAPHALTSLQRRGVLAATLAVVLSRIALLARSPWDWDEILFSLALRHFDVALHHPHPPGFPLFIGAAKLLQLAGFPEFRALQALNVVASIFLVPAMFALCRELRLRYATALTAALFLAFFPNVWFFSETAFSDVPSVVLVVGACALLFAGCRSDRSYVGGALLLAAAAAFRPQNLAVGWLAALVATRCRLRAGRRRTVVGAGLAAVAVLAVSYGSAIAATGWPAYRDTLRRHQQYITATDSYRAPQRPPLTHLVDDFFVRPYRAPILNAVVTLLAALSLLVSLWRRRSGPLIAVASFLPFCIAAWLLLDFLSASRFSIGYAPLIALLAADGLALLLASAPAAELAAGIVLAGAMAAWTLPAVAEAHRTASPPVRAMAWIRAHVPPTARIYASDRVGPFAEWFLTGYPLTFVHPDGLLEAGRGWYVTDARTSAPGAMNFSRPPGRAWKLVRHRYFDVMVLPVRGAVRIAPASWRWAEAGRGAVVLPPAYGRALLKLTFTVQTTGGTAILRLNGREIARLLEEDEVVDVERLVPATGPATLQLESPVPVRVDDLQWLLQ